MARKITKELAALRPKMCNYLTDDDYIDKKVKDTNECVINQEFKLKGYKTILRMMK